MTFSKLAFRRELVKCISGKYHYDYDLQLSFTNIEVKLPGPTTIYLKHGGDSTDRQK